MIPTETQQNVGSNATALHINRNWDVLLIDSQGVVLSRIAAGKTYQQALALAARGHSGGVVVLVPQLTHEEDCQPKHP
jgi:hypothetical protein